MTSIRKRCKRRVAWVTFRRGLSITLDSYPGGSEVKPVLRFKKRPWPRCKPLSHVHSLSDLLLGKPPICLSPTAPDTAKVIPDHVIVCRHDDPARLMEAFQIRGNDWIIGVDPGDGVSEKAVACRILKGRNPVDSVISYQLVEFNDYGLTAVKLK